MTLVCGSVALLALSATALVPPLRAGSPNMRLGLPYGSALSHGQRRSGTAALQPAMPLSRSCTPRMEEDEGPSETLQALGVLSGISAFCVIFFNTLTSAGVDDIVAGNLLLVALAAAGKRSPLYKAGLQGWRPMRASP
eukprot:scaffold137219_cov31-Tisochrysis_lutea.AAC.3